MRAIEHYTGDKGIDYHVRRTELRNSQLQKKRAALFAELAGDTLCLLDFGCGTGEVASNLRANRRIGVEVNPLASQEASKKLDLVVEDLSQVPDASVDLIISYHALEHVDNPSSIVMEMARVLKPAGKVRIIVPCEMPLIARHHLVWRDRDPDMHLNSWTPLTLGNLLKVSGFEPHESCLLPASEGGRLARILPRDSMLHRFALHLKAIRNGRYHTIVTASRR